MFFIEENSGEVLKWRIKFDTFPARKKQLFSLINMIIILLNFAYRSFGEKIKSSHWIFYLS